MNQINFSGYITPYAYVLFILLLPFDVPKTALLISAFVLGLSIDMFMDSLGMHAAACVFMAFFRPAVINLISLKKDFEEGSIPTIKNNGLRWMAAYTLILVFIHHGFLFFVEVFSLAEFWQTIGRTLLSSATTFVIIIIFYYLFGKLSKK
ncbi:MAG: rod shape-determining protein MreD [Bacteroidota bacterium]